MVTDDKAFDKLGANGQREKAQTSTDAVKFQTEAVGSSGTEVYGGMFSEEYLHTLQGPEAAKMYDKMRRSETQVAMVLLAIYNAIKAASWEVKPYKEEPAFQTHAELVKFNLFEQIDFESFKHEVLSAIPFGYAVFETVHNVVFNHPKFGTVNGLACLGFRSQKTIQTWKLEKKTGKLLALEQLGSGDVASQVWIPGEFIFVVSVGKEGDNYEGISALRPMFGAYSRKQTYLKLTAIGVEKGAIGTPIGTAPANTIGTKEYDEFKKVLRSFTSHEQAFIIRPEGWPIDVHKNDFDPSKMVPLLNFENTEMVNAVVANFLALGMNSSGGAFSLSNDLSDFFSNGLQAYANIICTALNRSVIPNLVKLNFGQQPGYPTMQVSGISDKAGKELAEILGTLIDKKAVRPDTPLEAFLRKQYKLPNADEKTTRVVEQTSVSANISAQPKTFSEPNANDKYVKEIESGKADVKTLMQKHLKEMADDLKKKLKIKVKGGDEGDKIEAPTEVSIDPKLISEYEAALTDALAVVAATAYKGAIAEVPKRTKKLSEYFASVKLAAAKGSGFYEALPENVKKIVKSQAALLAQSQPADITKIVTFQFASSNTGTEDPDQVESDIDEAVDKTLEGSNSKGMSVDAAAGDVVAHVATQARTEHFFDPEVLNEIESFTFENNDPVSEVCSDLAGTTFAPDDPQVDTYNPPLHHNCKSRMKANLKGVSGNPEIDEGDVELSKAAQKSITL